MARAFLLLVAAAAIVGVMTRGMPHRAPVAASIVRAGPAPQRLAASAREAPGIKTAADAVTLERSGDGHFYADVEINGTAVLMLVDTGASGIALSRDDARSAGIATSIGMNDVIGEGADGAVRGEPVRINRIRLGSTSAENVAAVVFNAGQMSLLGQDFLKRFESVEIRDDRMVLR